jgi:hypothetical protein
MWDLKLYGGIFVGCLLFYLLMYVDLILTLDPVSNDKVGNTTKSAVADPMETSFRTFQKNKEGNKDILIEQMSPLISTMLVEAIVDALPQQINHLFDLIQQGRR